MHRASGSSYKNTLQRQWLAKQQNEIRPLVNPHASAIEQDKQLRAQIAWDKAHSK